MGYERKKYKRMISNNNNKITILGFSQEQREKIDLLLEKILDLFRFMKWKKNYVRKNATLEEDKW
jgi:hypothetical protein